MRQQARLSPCPAVGDIGPVLDCPLSPGTALIIARETRWLLRNPGTVRSDDGIRTALVELLLEAAWMQPNGRLRPGIAAAFTDRFGRDALQFLGCLARERARSNWISDLCGVHHDEARHPLRFILLSAFLGETLGGFLERADRAARPRRGTPGRRLGRVRNALATQHITERHRAKLVDVLLEHPGIGRKEIRKWAGGAPAYLARHDREWFEKMLPPRRRDCVGQSWEARDSEVLEQVTAAIARVQVAETGRPRRVTPHRILVEAGQTNQAGRRSRLPRTFAAIDAVVEDEGTFMRRKLRWAAASMRAERQRFTWTRFRTLASYAPGRFGPEVDAFAYEAFQDLQG